MNGLPDTPLEDWISAIRFLGQQVCNALEQECHKLGFAEEQIPHVNFDTLMFELKRDPFSQEDSLAGTWLGDHRRRLGSLVVHADGSFFAEYDVARPHPHKPRWFVEAVTAWGQANSANTGMVKTEARLLPAI